MRRTISLLASAAALALAAAPPAGAATTPAAGTTTPSSKTMKSLVKSRELWATIDVCSPTDQPYTLGVRGSMPGDGAAGEKMFMSFRLQYLNTQTGTWVDLSSAASHYVAVGTALSARQGGRSFQLVPGKAPFTLRGVVGFQWRRGSRIVQSASRPTTAAHRSLAGADPAGYSAASCLIG